jgi:hypothetical protein
LTETTLPSRHWYVIVSGWVDAYVTNFTTMADPSLERIEGEEKQLAKLTSSSFDSLLDYEEVLNDARMWVQLISGAMHINQDAGPLQIVYVVEVFGDGTTQKHPPHGRPRKIRSGIPTVSAWNVGATPRATFEQSVVQFAHRSGNPLVTDALRLLTSPDWFGLYKALEVVNAPIVANGCATEDEIKLFSDTVHVHRHWKQKAPPALMDLIDARHLVGRIITKWLIDVSTRSVAA